MMNTVRDINDFRLLVILISWLHGLSEPRLYLGEMREKVICDAWNAL